MTQTVERKITYPKGRMVVIRDCTVAICCHHNSGATLLSTLLFWYDHPQKYDTYNDKEHTFTVCRTQAEIEEAACHQIDAKTIHDSAVPLLHLFGYLTVKEKMNGNLYTLHMDCVFSAYTAYEQGVKATRTFLKSQLEKMLIDLPPVQLEKMLINKRSLSLQLEKTLIQLRENSHCKRGRKPKSKEVAEDVSEKDRISKNIKENSNRDSLVVSANAENNEGTSLSLSSSLEEKETQPVEAIPEEGQHNGNAPLGAFQRAEVPEERRASALPSGHTSEAEGLEASTSMQQDTIPEYAAQEQENNPATSKTNGKGKIQTRTGAKTGSTKKKADDRTPEEKIRCQSWQAFFNARRGGEPLHKIGPRIDESDCIIVLVQKFSDAEITAIDTFVLTEKYPYTKPSEKHKVGARIVLDEHQNARECLKERGQWPGQEPPKPNSFVPEEYDAEKELDHWIGINELGRSPSHAAAL